MPARLNSLRFLFGAARMGTMSANAAPRGPERIRRALAGGYPVVYIQSWEEGRVERALTALAQKYFEKPAPFGVWTCVDGLRVGDERWPETSDPLKALDAVLESPGPGFFLMKDLPGFLPARIDVVRRLRDLYRQIRGRGKFVFLLSPRLVLPNDLAAARRVLTGLALDLIILSGGNDPPGIDCGDRATSRDAVEWWLLDHAEARALPVLGICHGAQVLAVRAGARLRDHADGHGGVRHDVVRTAAVPWVWPDRFTVDSHHRWAITGDEPATGLLPVAVAADHTIEAFRIAGLPWWGLMWHPEREDPPGPATSVLEWLLTRREHRAAAAVNGHAPEGLAPDDRRRQERNPR